MAKKSLILYASWTGNTEKVARAIQKGVKQAAGHCDIVKIQQANPRHLYEYDLIGLGCPVMGFAEPVNVRAFIKDMRFVGGKHIFPFATHGTRPEFFYPSIVPKLKRRGLSVIGMYNCYANVFMLGSPNPYPTEGHPDEIDLKEAEDFGREIVERSQRISAGETGLVLPLPEWSEPNLAKYLKDRNEREHELDVAIKVRPRAVFQYQKEKCRYPDCRICMDNCPMCGIDLSMKTPVIGKPCMRCGLCKLTCPTGAIERKDFIPGLDHRWNVLKAYYLDPLVKAEAEGRFRRLVPVEDVGWDTPLSKEDAKYPKGITQ